MLYICYGMPKSASTFAFQLARDFARTVSSQEELKARMPEDLKHPFLGDMKESLRRVSQCIPQYEIYVVKTHAPMSDRLKPMLTQGDVKAFATFRNPYDIVVSLKDAGETERHKEKERQREWFTNIKTYEDALQHLPPILNAASDWLQRPDVLKLSFSAIKNQALSVAKQIAAHMGITDLDVDAFVKKYLSKKELIGEYNVGAEGRGYKEFSLPDHDPVKQQMDQFIRQYMQDN